MRMHNPVTAWRMYRLRQMSTLARYEPILEKKPSGKPRPMLTQDAEAYVRSIERISGSEGVSAMRYFNKQMHWKKKMRRLTLTGFICLTAAIPIRHFIDVDSAAIIAATITGIAVGHGITNEWHKKRFLDALGKVGPWIMMNVNHNKPPI